MSDIYLGEEPNPAIVWHWFVFGDKSGHSLMLVQFTTEVPLWRRILTTVLLGSKWVRIIHRGNGEVSNG